METKELTKRYNELKAIKNKIRELDKAVENANIRREELEKELINAIRWQS